MMLLLVIYDQQHRQQQHLNIYDVVVVGYIRPTTPILSFDTWPQLCYICMYNTTLIKVQGSTYRPWGFGRIVNISQGQDTEYANKLLYPYIWLARCAEKC